MNEKRIIEAALFVSARELSLYEMKKLTGSKHIKQVRKIVDELKKEYEKSNGAIEIVEDNEKYLMRLKQEYADQVREFAQDAEVSKGGLKVLSYVYMNKGNILKSQIAKKLGPWIYPYVKELIEKDFLSAKRAGRTSRLVVTDKFKRYFSSEGL